MRPPKRERSPPEPADDRATPRRVGVFGGSFDPVHRGHLHLAHAALDRLGLAEVRFLPAPRAPHKRHHRQTPVEVRVELLRAAIAGEPRFVIDDTELHAGGSGYTFDTLTAMRARDGGGATLCFLIGGDSLRDLPKWHRARELAEQFDLVTVPRAPGLDEAAALQGAFPPALVEKLRRNVLDVRPLPISSTEVRARCRGGASEDELAELVPDVVAREIVRRGLYREGGGSPRSD